MNVLHVLGDLGEGTGGASEVPAALGCAQANLASCPTNVTLLSRSDPNAPGTTSPYQAWLGFDRVRIRHANELDAAVREADLLHFHGVWETLLARAGRSARRFGKPYTVSPHGMLDPWSLTQSRWKKRLALRFYAREMLNGAAALHVLNDDEARLMKPLGLSAPTITIPNGVFLDSAPADPRVGPAMEAAQPYALFLGRLHFKKGLDYLADAFALAAQEAPALRLVVAGPDEGALPAFLQRIDDAGLRDRVTVPGPVYGAAKRSWLDHAAGFVLPSRQEGFSVAVIEAMASGIPVVLSEHCHFPQVVDHDAGWVVPLNADAIAAKLVELVDSPEHTRAMGRRGAALVRRDYTWDAVAQRMLTHYAALRSGGGGRS